MDMMCIVDFSLRIVCVMPMKGPMVIRRIPLKRSVNPTRGFITTMHNGAYEEHRAYERHDILSMERICCLILCVGT